MSIGGIILNGLSQAFSNFMSGVGSHASNKVFGESLADRHRYALEQMAKQQEYNVENYKMQRDDQLRFTDPSFIRQRLERAGLSSSLALSNGAFSPGLSTSIGSSSTAGGLSGSPLAHGTNILETMARIRNLNADTDNKTTDADYKKQTLLSRVDMLKDSALSAKYKAEMDRVDSLFRESMNQANYDQIRAVIDKMSEDIANNKNLTEIQRQKMNAYVDSVVGQLSLWDSEIGLNQAKQVTEGTQQVLNKSLSRLNDAKSWSQEFENFKWQNNGTIKPGMNLLQGVTALIADLPSNLQKSFKEVQSIGNYIDDKFNNLKNIVIKDVETFIDDVNEIASNTNKLDSFIRMLEKNVDKFANYK